MENLVGVKRFLLIRGGRGDFGQRMGQLGPRRDAPTREPSNSASGLVSAGVASCFLGLFLLVALEGSLLALTSRRRTPQIGPPGKIPIVSGQRGCVRGSFSLSRLVPFNPVKTAPF